MNKVRGHNKRVNLNSRTNKNRPKSSAVSVLSYTVLKPSTSKINMNIRNPTSREITVKAKLITAGIAAANMVPPMLVQGNSQKTEEWLDKRTEPPNLNSKIGTKTKLTKNQLEKLFQKIDLSGIKDWSEKDQKDVKILIKDSGFLFNLNDPDLGKTATVKHTIKLMYYTPFKEQYQRAILQNATTSV